ncbi:MAG: fumarate reductase subunit C, partial [Candidatus Acidiferrales bacterium]
MSSAPRYTEHHPRWYRERVSTYWWLWRWQYLKFVLREITSVPVAWFVVVTLLQIRALALGPEAYAQFQRWMSSPFLLAVNTVSFGFVLFHAITWFNLAPAAMVVRVGGKRVPPMAIIAA